MAEKKFKIVIQVYLDCRRCKKKIRRVVSKLQDRENVDSVEYDDKNNKVTITGSFDPERLSWKLRCKACKCIKGIEIIEVKPPPPPKPEEPKPEEPKPEVVWVVCCPQPCPCHKDRMGPCCYCRCKKAAHEEEKKAPCCCHLCKEDKKAPCCWEPCPCYHGFPYHGYRCCSCGQHHGCSPPPKKPEKPSEKPPEKPPEKPSEKPPAPPACPPYPCPPYPCPPYPCQIVYVEDPPNPCIVM